MSVNPIPETKTHRRARIAALTRSRRPDDPDLVHERQALKVDNLTESIRLAVDSWPPLTQEQRARLAAILRPAVGGDGR